VRKEEGMIEQLIQCSASKVDGVIDLFIDSAVIIGVLNLFMLATRKLL
jgi:hypothetical protein